VMDWVVSLELGVVLIPGIHAVVVPDYVLPHRHDEQKVSLKHEVAVLLPG